MVNVVADSDAVLRTFTGQDPNDDAGDFQNKVENGLLSLVPSQVHVMTKTPTNPDQNNTQLHMRNSSLSKM